MPGIKSKAALRLLYFVVGFASIDSDIFIQIASVVSFMPPGLGFTIEKCPLCSCEMKIRRQDRDKIRVPFDQPS